MLLNEIEILRSIKHPNVITLYEIYEDFDYIHLVMEHLQGGELLERTIRKGNYSEEDATSIMRKLLEIVKYYHGLNIMHRDIKPENILLEDSMSDINFKLIDFGLAIISAPGKKETSKYGSPGYTAPEILLGQGYTNTVDIFSCGIILCFLLTGILPFAAEKVDEILEKNKICDIHMDTIAWRNVSYGAKDLVKKMTMKDPSQRISAEVALNHSWFKPIERLIPGIYVKCCTNIASFEEIASSAKTSHTPVSTSTIQQADPNKVESCNWMAEDEEDANVHNIPSFGLRKGPVRDTSSFIPNETAIKRLPKRTGELEVTRLKTLGCMDYSVFDRSFKLKAASRISSKEVGANCLMIIMVTEDNVTNIIQEVDEEKTERYPLMKMARINARQKTIMRESKYASNDLLMIKGKNGDDEKTPSLETAPSPIESEEKAMQQRKDPRLQAN